MTNSFGHTTFPPVPHDAPPSSPSLDVWGTRAWRYQPLLLTTTTSTDTIFAIAITVAPSVQTKRRVSSSSSSSPLLLHPKPLRATPLSMDPDYLQTPRPRHRTASSPSMISPNALQLPSTKQQPLHNDTKTGHLERLFPGDGPTTSKLSLRLPATLSQRACHSTLDANHKTHPSYNFPTERFQRCTQHWQLRQRQRQLRSTRNLIRKFDASKKTG